MKTWIIQEASDCLGISLPFTDLKSITTLEAWWIMKQFQNVHILAVCGIDWTNNSGSSVYESGYALYANNGCMASDVRFRRYGPGASAIFGGGRTSYYCDSAFAIPSEDEITMRNNGQPLSLLEQSSFLRDLSEQASYYTISHEYQPRAHDHNFAFFIENVKLGKRYILPVPVLDEDHIRHELLHHEIINANGKIIPLETPYLSRKTEKAILRWYNGDATKMRQVGEVLNTYQKDEQQNFSDEARLKTVLVNLRAGICTPSEAKEALSSLGPLSDRFWGSGLQAVATLALRVLEQVEQEPDPHHQQRRLLFWNPYAFPLVPEEQKYFDPR